VHYQLLFFNTGALYHTGAKHAFNIKPPAAVVMHQEVFVLDDG
jgi:hypothetical protein